MTLLNSIQKNRQNDWNLDLHKTRSQWAVEQPFPGTDSPDLSENNSIDG